jgi:hypothetical protein
MIEESGRGYGIRGLREDSGAEPDEPGLIGFIEHGERAGNMLARSGIQLRMPSAGEVDIFISGGSRSVVKVNSGL